MGRARVGWAFTQGDTEPPAGHVGDLRDFNILLRDIDLSRE